MYTMALDGYRWNHALARRYAGGDTRGLVGDDPWDVLPVGVRALGAEASLPYVSHAAYHQGQLLSDAMHAQDPARFESLRDRFAGLLRGLRRGWGEWPPQAATEVHEQVQRIVRLGLMGLAGRALMLRESGSIGDPSPYLGAARAEYATLMHLTADLPGALSYGRGDSALVWSQWASEGAERSVMRLQLERYPLTFFAVRLLELARAPMPELDLGGTARQVLEWFEANIDRLERHAHLEPGARSAERREIALGALRAAVSRDEVAKRSKK